MWGVCFHRMPTIPALLVPVSASAQFVTFDGDAKWGNPDVGTGAVVTWSLIPDGTGVVQRDFPPTEGFLYWEYWQGTSNLSSIYSQLDADPAMGEALFQTALQNAFNVWASVADLTFIQVGDDGTALGHTLTDAAEGNIRIGAFSLAAPFDAVAAHAFEPPNGTSSLNSYLEATGMTTTFGDVTLNTNAFFSVFPGYAEGDPTSGFPNDLEGLLIHEIGHALGLAHSFGENDIMNPDNYHHIQRTLSANDIAGIQYLYGVPEPSVAMLVGLSGLACGLRRNRKPAGPA